MKNLIKVFVVFLLFFVSANIVFANDIKIKKDNGIYHIILKGEKIKKQIKFVSSETLITNKEAHTRARSRLTVNAGFFDPKNSQTISYIVNDRVTIEDPRFNPSLTNSSPVINKQFVFQKKYVKNP